MFWASEFLVVFALLAPGLAWIVHPVLAAEWFRSMRMPSPGEGALSGLHFLAALFAAVAGLAFLYFTLERMSYGCSPTGPCG